MSDLIETEDRPRRAVVVAVQLPSVSDGEFEDSLVELERLAKTLGVIPVTRLTQRRASFDRGSYLGSGKLEELEILVKGGTVDTILVDHEISPSQARNLEKGTDATVMDRTAVILEIFHRHARSRVAKAQVEIVRLKYMAPRLREQGKGQKERQLGKGAGESKMELDDRKIRDRIAELTEELALMESGAQTQRARRRDLNRVALVGYTNAGKSTLMRALTESDVYVADKLFATLDTTVRALVPETTPRILVSDTVGFIKKLPHGLVASFKSTLDEALEASLLAHVIDASDAAWERQLAVTEEVLTEIGAGDVPRLHLFNKIDRAGGGDPAREAEIAAKLIERFPGSIVMSAKRPTDIALLHDAFTAFFGKQLVEADLLVGWDRQELRGEIFASCQVLAEKADEAGAVFSVKAAPGVLDRLRGKLAGGKLPA